MVNMKDIFKKWDAENLTEKERYVEFVSIVVFGTRVNNKMTQSELAKLSGLDEKIIHRVEGGSIVEEHFYEKIFQALKISETELEEYKNKLL